MSFAQPADLPVIDFAAFERDGEASRRVAEQINQACRESGFFYLKGHGVSDSLCRRLDELSRKFFAQDDKTKLAIRMETGGRAWRGYFPVGGELTSGRPDQKEGIYFGSELSAEHPKVRAGTPLFGANLFPSLPGFRETVLQYLDVFTELGHRLMRAVAMSLGLEPAYFHERYTRDPLILFRIFHYPPMESAESDHANWGVGEHTDYGLLTILRQDEIGGLEVKSPNGWLSAPPIPGAFICNIGDMLELLTGGFYRSTPHRVRNTGKAGRLSFPFFFDPNWDAELEPIREPQEIEAGKEQRWDKASVHEFSGTYGDYVLQKVAKVFPELSSQNT